MKITELIQLLLGRSTLELDPHLTVHQTTDVDLAAMVTEDELPELANDDLAPFFGNSDDQPAIDFTKIPAIVDQPPIHTPQMRVEIPPIKDKAMKDYLEKAHLPTEETHARPRRNIRPPTFFHGDQTIKPRKAHPKIDKVAVKIHQKAAVHTDKDHDDSRQDKVRKNHMKIRARIKRKEQKAYELAGEAHLKELNKTNATLLKELSALRRQVRELGNEVEKSRSETEAPTTASVFLL